MTHKETGGELTVLDAVRAALKSETQLGTCFNPNRLELDADGVLIFEAEVETVAQKKVALKAAAAPPEITGIVDRVRVAPTDKMEDAEICAHLRAVYSQDPALAGLKTREYRGAGCETINDPPDPHGSIDYEVVDGIVTLNGSVRGLTTKRYIGVLAWWIPGSCDVVNGMVVEPDEEDGADKIAEAVHLVLEKNPYLDVAQIKVGVRVRTVRLTGFLPSDAQRDMAENDAWCVFGVDTVINEIEIGK